jgi:hypothetical protein
MAHEQTNASPSTVERAAPLASSGPDEQASPTGEVPMLTDERIAEIGHRTAWRYKHSIDPSHSDTYTFNDVWLTIFARAIESEVLARVAAAQEKQK